MWAFRLVCLVYVCLAWTPYTWEIISSFRTRLHQAQALTQNQHCDDASDTALIEINRTIYSCSRMELQSILKWLHFFQWEPCHNDHQGVDFVLMLMLGVNWPLRCVYMLWSCSCPSKFIIMSMVMSSLTGRMSLSPILPVKLPVTISTILNFDTHCDGERERSRSM